jgi:hypothetical protein
LTLRIRLLSLAKLTSVVAMIRTYSRKRIGAFFLAAALGAGYFYTTRNADRLLTAAAEKGQTFASSVLLRIGADVRYDDDAPLRWAATQTL